MSRACRLLAAVLLTVGSSAQAINMGPPPEPPRHPKGVNTAFLALSLVPRGPTGAGASAPSKHRLPMQLDFDRCAFTAEELGNHSLAGRVQLELLVRPSGNVFAAFVRSDRGGVDDRRFQRCLTAVAPLWVFEPVPTDYQRAYAVSFVPSGSDISVKMHNGEGLTGGGRPTAFLPDLADVPAWTPLDAKVAQSTLEVAEFATLAEHAVAELAVHRFADSVTHARVALAADPNDTLALRTLAHSLIESGGDVAEARLHAERLAALLPDSVVGHESLLRVCLATGDDFCAVHEFRRAKAAADVVPRSRLLAELHQSTQVAADRMARRDRRQGDPCALEQSDEAQALCVVKRCLDEGSAIYARELASRASVPYEAGDWRVIAIDSHRLLVTRPIEPVAERAGVSIWTLDRHDARWVVELGPELVLQPQNGDARAITMKHSWCSARSRLATQVAR